MKIAVCAICRNEYLYLKEWVSFYKLVGFDDIFIYDNLSNDGTSELMLALDAENIIKRVFWPRIEGVPPQRSAYSHFINNFSSDYDFVLICDLDELLIVPDYNVKLFLKHALHDNPHIGAIAIPWLIFGSGGQEDYKNELVVDRFINCDESVSNVVKTIFRPSCVQNMRTHICDLISGEYVAGDLTPASWHEIHPHWVINNNEDGAVIYHYYTKSKGEWIKRRSVPKADRPTLEKRHTDEYELYSKQTRVNLKAKALSAGIYSIIQSIDASLEGLSTRFNQLKIKVIDLTNDWIFGVVEGAFEGVVILNLIINSELEFKIKVESLGNNNTPFIFKLKWFSPKIDNINLTLVGTGVSTTIKPQHFSDLNQKFKLLCEHFPSAEEHIFSSFVSLVGHGIDPKNTYIARALIFNKYLKHKFFINHMLNYIESGNASELLEFVSKNSNYRKFLPKNII